VLGGRGLAVGGWVPSKNSQRFPSLLEEPDFWPVTMVEEKGQPMGEKGLGGKWEKVGRKEGNRQVGAPGERGLTLQGQGSR